MSFLGFESKTETFRKKQEISKLQQMIDVMPSIVMLCDATHDNEVFYMNTMARETIMHYRPQLNEGLGGRADVANVMDNSIHQFHANPDRIRKILADVGSLPHIAEIPLGGVTFMTRAYPVWDSVEPNTVLCYMACWNDISADKRVESQRVEAANAKRYLEGRVEQIATAMEEMSASVAEVAKNAGHASKAAVEVSDNAIRGQDVVAEAVEGMRKVANVVRESSEIITKLGSKSDEVKDIVTIIENIAEQTHLLALNAAIEAARAGEEGRGFAVVADEVKKLAESTTRSTKETSDILAEIVSVSAKAVAIMDEGKKEAAAGEELSGKAGEALDKIVSEIDSVKNVITQIATASEQQSATAEEIAQNLEEITHRAGDENTFNGNANLTLVEAKV